MSWEREHLWSKAVLFMQRASAEDRDGSLFGLWASLGLELLARAAVAKTSSALLAEPDREQKNLLHVLGVSSSSAPKSIPAIQVLSLCRTLVPGFTDEESKAASSLLNRRNEELHTGAAAFATFPTQVWLAGFYRCCKVLAEHQGESLDSLFGEDEAKVAIEILGKVEAGVLAKVKGSIAAHTRVFEEKDAGERARLSQEAEAESEALSHRWHHRVACPACKSIATVQGAAYGGERLEHKNDVIVVRENVIPTKFQCRACGLKLDGYQELVAAGVGDHFTHRMEYSPPAYYELLDPYDHEAMAKYADDHGFYQFSNE